MRIKCRVVVSDEEGKCDFAKAEWRSFFFFLKIGVLCFFLLLEMTGGLARSYIFTFLVLNESLGDALLAAD